METPQPGRGTEGEEGWARTLTVQAELREDLKAAGFITC